MADRDELYDAALRENVELRLRLEEAEEALHAIRSGQVDAFVVAGPDSEQIYTLVTADRPYRLFVEAMQHGAATLTQDGTILFCNDYLARLLNETPERLTGVRLRDLVSDEDCAEFDASMAGGSCEIRLRGGGDEGLPVSLNVRPLSDEPTAAYCVLVTDLTQQRLYEDLKNTEEALRETEERFRMLAENMDQLAWTCDSLGNVTWYNQRWLNYTGMTFEELKGWGWKKVHHPDYVDAVVKTVERSRDTGEPWDHTFPLRGKDGNYRWFLSRAVPILDNSGKTVRWFGTNTDVTDQLRTQEQLAAAVQEMAAADRRKTEFLAILGHELRNPLAPMRTGLEAIKLVSDDPEKVERIRATMERQTLHLTRLIDDLLDVSRIAQGKMTLEKRRVLLSDVVLSAVEEVRAAINETGQQLVVNLPDEPISLDADPNRLAQILSNLLNNAAKYTPKEGHIWLTAERQNGSVVLAVRDDGIGIPSDLQARIFEMFSQIDRPVEKGYRGLGIGLNLVKRLVELHDGKIEVASAGAGKGSEFRLELPLPANSPQLSDTPTDGASSDGASSSGVGCRVLIADDNTAAADMLGLVVKMLGNEVRTAHDGREAVQLAEEFRPDVVLMDIGMPNMDGYEAAREIRRQPWGEHMELVALTGWGQDEDKIRTAMAGFDHHWVKPPEPAALRALMAAHSRTR